MAILLLQRLLQNISDVLYPSSVIQKSRIEATERSDGTEWRNRVTERSDEAKRRSEATERSDKAKRRSEATEQSDGAKRRNRVTEQSDDYVRNASGVSHPSLNHPSSNYSIDHSFHWSFNHSMLFRLHYPGKSTSAFSKNWLQGTQAEHKRIESLPLEKWQLLRLGKTQTI